MHANAQKSRELHVEKLPKVVKTRYHKPTTFGDTLAAEHKVLSEEIESGLQHRHAVVVQDLDTQWILSYPCRNKIADDTMRRLQRFLPPENKSGV